jgi:hypothetical protein
MDGPLVPYGEGYVLLACRHGRQCGWFVFTMPVDDRTACDGERSIGFPNYVADRLELEETDGAWLGRVAHEGREAMRVAFTPRSSSAAVGRDLSPGPARCAQPPRRPL